MKYRVIQVSLSVGIFLLTVVMFISIYNTQLGNRQIGKENQTYTRFNACVTSIPTSKRETDTTEIERCWTAVQKDTGVNVKRYDKEEGDL